MLQNVFLERMFRLKSGESEAGQNKLFNENFYNHNLLLSLNSICYELRKACNARGKQLKMYKK
jgi:hypothetical protein